MTIVIDNPLCRANLNCFLKKMGRGLVFFFLTKDYETRTGLEPHGKYKFVTFISAVVNDGLTAKEEQTPHFLHI